MLAITLILAGILLRLAPHAPNFTPVAAIALFSGAYLKKKYAFTIPLILIILSDLIIGLHNVVIFTWAGFALITFLGPWLKTRKNIFGIVGASCVSAVAFYAISNFGVWLMGWYPHTLKGLIDCYIMALPFLRNFTLATLVYLSVFVGIHELAARFLKDSALSKVLLEK